MTCPNRGKFSLKEGTTGWLWKDEYVQKNELEIREDTNDYTYQPILEYDLLGKYWDKNSTQWSTEGID